MKSSRSAVISPCGKYRYHLRRRIGDGSGPVATFIMLNPSTADARVDDPTIRKCVGFSQRWGCGELHVVNLFALRALDPKQVGKTHDPGGPENQVWIERSVAPADIVICAWGNLGQLMRHDETVLGWVKDICEPMCLGVTKRGHPRHPLYVPYTTKLVPFGCAVS
jgi:hypothetical protein